MPRTDSRKANQRRRLHRQRIENRRRIEALKGETTPKPTES